MPIMWGSWFIESGPNLGHMVGKSKEKEKSTRRHMLTARIQKEIVVWYTLICIIILARKGIICGQQQLSFH